MISWGSLQYKSTNLTQCVQNWLHVLNITMLWPSGLLHSSTEMGHYQVPQNSEQIQMFLDVVSLLSVVQWDLDLRKPHHTKNSEYETSFKEISSHLTKKYSRYEYENRKCRPTMILLELISLPDIGLAVRVFANRPGDLGSIPGRVIPKTQKMVLDASLLNTQHYKVRIKGKVEQSRERSSALPYTLV